MGRADRPAEPLAGRRHGARPHWMRARLRRHPGNSAARRKISFF